jgi:hypothetical protein
MPAKTARAEPETIGVKDLPEHIRTRRPVGLPRFGGHLRYVS